ncbi:MAG: methyltransferase domain-containing protein [Cyanobacteriota bacterium]|nr:methyltransferase domain-containing protein [Cyanobacteriota bacterium]
MSAEFQNNLQNSVQTQIIEQVRQLYNTFPFPPEPLSTVPPPGWNWRWSWVQAHAFCTGSHPGSRPVRILDAGCGSGVGTEYIAHQNPTADLWAFDLSENALAIAQSRCLQSQAPPVQFRELSVYDIDQLPGTFDFINCVGMLHHLPDPVAGLQALASKLGEGGILHIFVYGELGRWEIRLMQKALRLLVGGDEDIAFSHVDQLQKGLVAGRKIFEIMPEQNRILQQEKARWAVENKDDECFADMYLHPQEIDYNIDTLFEWIDTSHLEFLGFSNPSFWQLERLLGKAPEWLAEAQQLPRQRQYRLIELLDPTVAHYEFFLGKPPILKPMWTPETIGSAIAHRSPCLGRWPSQSVFNYVYDAINLSDGAYQFLLKVDGQKTVNHIQKDLELERGEGIPESTIHDLQRWQVLLLEPSQHD